jgi:chaperone LolA
MKIFITLMMLFVSSSAYAAALPAPLSKGLQQLAKLSGFSCRFEQTVFYSDGSKQSYQGTLAVARFGHFRWHYTKPYEQLYVSNGHGIWLYEPDLLQAQWLESLDAVDPVAMRLLEGRVKAKEVHLLDEQAGVYHVRIGDKKDAPELWLSLNRKGMPVWFESRDSLDNRNRMRLISIQQKKPAMKQFEFEVPEGIDVVDANGMLMERQ